MTRQEFKKAAQEILKEVSNLEEFSWGSIQGGCLLERAAAKFGTSWHYLKQDFGGPLSNCEVAALYGMNDEGHLERLRHLVELL
jgi:hypothetical protein